MASDKSGRTKRPGAATPDPRVDDLTDASGTSRSRSGVPRPVPAENPLDRITSFETSERPVPGFPAIVPAEIPDFDVTAEPAPAAVLTAPPPLAPPEEAESDVAAVIAPADPVPTEAMPATVTPAAAAALLDLGGPHETRNENGTPQNTATVERVLGPLAQLRPPHRPVVFRTSGRPRVRRVTRVLRHLDTWSVFKVAVVFNLVLYVVCLTAGVLLWNVAYTTGTIDNVENFFEQFGWESFEFRGGEIYHNAWIAGLFVAIGLTGLAVLLATLFNLITDLVGGIRVTVLEEEVVAGTTPRVPRVRARGLNLSAPKVVPPAPPAEDPNNAVDSGP